MEKIKKPNGFWKTLELKKRRAKDLEGMLVEDNLYGTLKVVKYHNASQILVELVEERRTLMVSLNTLLNKKVKTPYTKIVKGVGYLGEGKYRSGTHRSSYVVWKRDIEVLPEKYHNFQVFAKDYYNGGINLEEG